MKVFTSLFCFAFVSLGVLSDDNELRIHSTSEFITFLKSPSDYTGTTVYLESDLDLSGSFSNEFEPKSFFSGVFDGQGHTISNLIIRSFATNVGLFGHSYGGSIRNIVIGSTCSFTSNYTENNVYVGSITSIASSRKDNIQISNIVNMANISFEGNTTGNNTVSLMAGGIAGYVYSSNYEATVNNCVNYGTVVHSGIVNRNAYLGGIVGQSYENSVLGTSYIQNCLNYGTVVNNGTSKDLYIGGIVGYISSSKHSTHIRNCANYGTIRYSGTSRNIRIGGIIGYPRSNLPIYIYIQNCLNYGTLIDNGIKTIFNIGGIVGLSSGTVLTNCVSAGKILSDTDYKGGIVGNVNLNTSITHCLWTSDTGCNEAHGRGISSLSITGSSLVIFNSSIVRELNEYAEINGWNKWIINKNSDSVTFKVSNEKVLTFSSQLILLPNVSSEWRSFDGWYTDDGFETPFNSLEIIGSTTLYGKWDKYRVSFDMNGGENISYSSNGISHNYFYSEFPVVNKTGYKLIGWFTRSEGGIKVEESSRVTYDHTLYAQWIPNNYTVSFDVNGGNELGTREKEVTFDSIYGTLPTPNREGYSFIGWLTEDDESITEDSIVKISSDHTLYAQWVPNNYTVTSDLGNGTKIENAFQYNARIVHPENMAREGYTFSGWINDTEYMPAHNLTITAQWVPNNYTVLFNVNGGEELDIKEMTVTFNSPYGPLPTPNRSGYTFVGWFNKNNENISDTTIVSIADNHTLYAQWKEISTPYVEVIFGTKDLTKEEIKEIVKQYTGNDDFEIIKIESSESGNTKVIIKFIDVETAENFVENIRESSAMNTLIKSVIFISGSVNSFSSKFYPSTFFSFFLV